MHLASLDHMSNDGDSPLHRLQPGIKIWMAAFSVAGVVITGSVPRLAVYLLLLGLLTALSRNPARELLQLAVYPLFFSMLFALLQLQHSWSAALLVVFKAMAAAGTLILLISTTSYVDIFGCLSKYLPPLLMDAFVFTYRALFILLDQLQNLLRSIRLRGGYHPLKLALNLRSSAGMLGVLIIHAFDMSDRMYRIYALRGYRGCVPMSRNAKRPGLSEVIALAFSILILIGMVIPWPL